MGFYTFSRSGEQRGQVGRLGCAGVLEPEQSRPLPIRLEPRRVLGSTWRRPSGASSTCGAWRWIRPRSRGVRAERLTTGGGTDINTALSQDETRIAYVQQVSSFRLWSFPFDAGSGRLTGEGTAFSEEGAFAADVDLSADGKRPCTSLVRPGSRPRRDLGAPIRHQSAAVAGPGRNDSEVGARRSQHRVHQVAQRLRVDVDAARAQRRRTPAESMEDASLPTRAYGRFQGGHSMLVECIERHRRHTALALEPRRIAARNPRRSSSIARGPTSGRRRLSPNGRWLAFVPETAGRPVPLKVAVARVDSTPITEWTDAVPTLSNTDKPRWAPDGRTLYFLTNRGGFYNLAGIRFDPDRGIAVGQPFDVTHFTLSKSDSRAVHGSGRNRHRGTPRGAADDVVDGQHLDARQRRQITSAWRAEVLGCWVPRAVPGATCLVRCPLPPTGTLVEQRL